MITAKKTFRGFILIIMILCFALISCAFSDNNEYGLSAAATEKGINLTADVPDNCNYIFFYRRISGTNDWNSFCYVDTFDLSGYLPESISLPDYFAEKDKTYEYYCNFYDEHFSIICESPVTSVTSTTDSVKLLNNKPVATYKAETGLMTFTTAPEIDLPESDMTAKLFVDYKHGDKNFGLLVNENYASTLYWSRDYSDKVADYNSIQILLKKNDAASKITYSWVNIIDDSEQSGMPATITIPKPITQTITPTTEGNEISISVPYEKPYKTREMIITREKEDKSSSTIEIVANEYIPSGNFTVMDYFAKSGTEYKYSCTFYSPDNKEICTSEDTSVTATGGCGELEFTSVKPVATYEPTTGIMTFTTVPTNKELTNPPSDIKINVCFTYLGSNYYNYLMAPEANNTIDWSYFSDRAGQTLKYSKMDVYGERCDAVTKITYFWISTPDKSAQAGLPETITLP